jgi:hypothetical protein
MRYSNLGRKIYIAKLKKGIDWSIWTHYKMRFKKEKSKKKNDKSR